MRWRGFATCQRYTDEQRYNHRYTLLSFQQILCQEAAASTVGAGGSSPCLKGRCVFVCVCVYTAQLKLQLVLPVTKHGVTSLQGNMGLLSRKMQDKL